MNIIDDNRCIVCGKDNPIGLQVKFNIDPDNKRAEATVNIPEVFQGWQGIIHGGIISALLDEIGAQACMGSGLTVVTSELKIKYRAPVPTGATVYISGEVVGERRRIIDVASRLELNGQIMAEAEAVMFRTS